MYKMGFMYSVESNSKKQSPSLAVWRIGRRLFPLHNPRSAEAVKTTAGGLSTTPLFQCRAPDKNVAGIPLLKSLV